MDKTDYRIESLISTFIKHGEEVYKRNEESIARYKELFPESELPEWLNNDFNISTALSVICAEIEKIKHFLGIKEIN